MIIISKSVIRQDWEDHKVFRRMSEWREEFIKIIATIS